MTYHKYAKKHVLLAHEITRELGSKIHAGLMKIKIQYSGRTDDCSSIENLNPLSNESSFVPKCIVDILKMQYFSQLKLFWGHVMLFIVKKFVLMGKFILSLKAFSSNFLAVI